MCGNGCGNKVSGCHDHYHGHHNHNICDSRKRCCANVPCYVSALPYSTKTEYINKYHLENVDYNHHHDHHHNHNHHGCHSHDHHGHGHHCN
jgi:hypothetical protein